MFYMSSDDPDDTEKSLATICALGSQDKSISIWVTKFSRPICVAADIFDNNVYDIAWTPDGKSLFACSQDGTVACLQLDAELEHVAPDDAIYKELVKYGYGRKKTQLPETPIQLDLEDEQAKATVEKASSSKRLADLMEGNTTLTTPQEQPPTDDVVMIEPEPIIIEKPNNMTSSSSTTATIMEQKVSVAKNGKKRIQPVMLSSSSTSVTTNAVPKPSQTTAKLVSTSNHVQQMEYDDPSLPSQGVGSAIQGNKRKVEETDTDENQVAGTKSSRVKPEWIDSAVAPPVLQKSLVKMGIPKVRSILSTKVRKEDPSTVMECHNAPSSQSRCRSVCVFK